MTDTDALLKQTWELQTADHPRSLQLLDELNRHAADLTPDQQWQLRLLNAWEAKYEGKYAQAEALFKDIAVHSGNPKLADRALSMLLSQYGITRHYSQMFDLANRMAARLPQIADADTRYAVLLNLAQAMGQAGQVDLAVHYAHLSMGQAVTADNRCYAAGVLVDVLFNGHRLKPGSAEMQQALMACPQTTQPLYHTSMLASLADLYAHGGQPRKALALLDQIQSRVNAAGYIPNRLTLLEARAWALAEIGEDDAARKAAQAILRAQPSADFDLWLIDAYEVLYRIEKKQGHAAAALDYYEKYAALDKAYLDDVNARAMAYETVQQHVLAQRLDTERLTQQNAALRMRQQLAAKTAEANRLYIILLLAVLAFGALAMFRLKRSQLRFRQLSRMDGLTAVLNRQSFMQDAEGVLRRLQRESGAASLLYLDLDHFKRLNDTHGHAVGDEALRQVVQACRQHLRPVDLFGRLGGEEFAILLIECARESAQVIANRIRRAIEQTEVYHDEMAVRVTSSVGVAFTASSGHDLQRLCADADAALYLAKDSGRNCVVADGGHAGAVA